MARINSKDTKMKAERIKDKEGGGKVKTTRWRYRQKKDAS